ncbi:hypothetical protein ccbrp13_02840 [Ktedonobacteria bacterium brp13]|nr:hypothetical protein ccbrp13_02840 [Ktedonobacteria bacterium brp13]
MKRIILSWILLAILITGIAWLPYLLVQQDLRQEANDPQIQLAEDSAASLNAGQTPQQIVAAATTSNAGSKVDIAKSLVPYIVIYDTTGKPVASSASLNGQDPSIPAGIFADVRKNGEDRISWQPPSDVRSAIIVTQYKDGFVMAGRSLREVEKREDNIEQFTLIAWLVLLVVALIDVIIIFWQDLRLKRA